MAEGLLTHIERVPVDADLARRQWDGYVAALHGAGWETVEVPPAPDCPDSAFVEDTVVMYADLAVITRPGADERRPETAGTEQVLRQMGYRIAHIEAPGTLDGGDVLKHGGTVWVGLGGRTNQAGVDQLAGHLEPLGARVVGVPVTKVLHLKSAVTALPDGTVVGFEELVDDPSVWSHFLAVPEEPGSHVVLTRRQRRPDVGQRTADPAPLRGPRPARRRRGRDGVREARRLRHLPVRPASRLTTSRPSSAGTRI
jgi:dimethylargininase